jgi:isocitrate dehydrogenase (NAD+)
MATHKVALIEGDGIGPEICASLKEIFGAVKAPIEWVSIKAGLAALESTGKGIEQAD